MERHIPVYPLPDTIQKMDPEETVCRYCGVSYLIHHEFKMMEEKMKAMELEMELYRASVENERRLQGDIQTLHSLLEQSRAQDEQQTESIKFLSTQLSEKESELRTVTSAMDSFQSKLNEAECQSQLLRRKCTLQNAVLKNTMSFLQLTKKELLTTRSTVACFPKLWREFAKEVTDRSKDAMAELTSLERAVGISQSEVVRLREQVNDLQSVSAAAELKSQQVQDLVQRESELQNRCHEMQKQILGLNSQLESLHVNLQQRSSEMEHFKQLVVAKSTETEQYLSRLKQSEIEQKETESRFCKKLREKDEAWLACQQKCRLLQEQLTEQTRKHEELSKRNGLSENENETLLDALKRAEEEIDTLRKERELTKLSHQNTIVQLRESFRQKMLEGHNLRTKFDEELEEERKHHFIEMQKAELKVREDANTELVIQREKFQELIQKYQKEHEELKSKVPSLIQKATMDLQAEIKCLESKLMDLHNTRREKESKKDQEMNHLMKQVSDLESQLSQENKNTENLTAQMKQELQQSSLKIKELTMELDQLTQESCQLQQENTLLQETVRRECEERYELTEALSQAREQLLELKKRSGGLQLSQRSSSQSVRIESPSPSASQGHKSMNTQRSGLAVKHGLLTRLAGSPDGQPGSSSTSALPAIPLPRPSKDRLFSISESKHRIAAVVRSRENKM
ncbi:leucine-, glutamate- and lysine-rich protein 1 isoform X1 [Polypterus senegalus]|uniref:leucine-, glutamate- and lysine-rich protein 1 isoform X1 n=1 Tax=Polypterus senegalus TaxID=55291 RepID=UPI001965284E|nr:leucine-, glutamate- and lysine-rich protein 1 isoform X1 [Polypterus senegalus]XP_039613163.1 leucine-, glutamate- and lysine-rich protein 1 isoform X1 [Polypterus senegalus]